MDNIQKRWTPYTNAISALGAKKLDFIFRERILVVLTYCPSGIFVHCPPFLGVNKTRLGYAPWSLHEQDGGREHFFWPFSDWQETAVPVSGKPVTGLFRKDSASKKTLKRHAGRIALHSLFGT